MSCENVTELISSLVDYRLPAGERDRLMAHLNSCTACSATLESMQQLRTDLRKMGAPVPARLQQKLRTMASYERVRQLSRASFASSPRSWLSDLQLTLENMMRPTFLPFAGGLLSAALAFGLLVPNLSFSHRFGDGPSTQIFTVPDGVVVGAVGEPPRIEPADAVGSDYQTVLELTVDNTGRVTDYEVTRGQLTPELKDLIMFSNFTPATFFGRRTTAKVKIFYGKLSIGMRS